MNAKQTLQDRIAAIRTAADELRVKLHLGGMEARSMWDELQPKLVKLEQQARDTAVDAIAGLEQGAHEMEHSLSELRKRLSS